MKTRMKVSRCCCDGGAPDGDYCDSCCDQSPVNDWSPDNEIDVTIGSYTVTLADNGIDGCCYIYEGPVIDGTPAIWWYVAQISGVCYMFVGVHCNDEGYLCEDLENGFDAIPGSTAYYRKALSDQDCEGAFPITLDLHDSKGVACTDFGTAGTWPATISLVLS